MADPIEDPLDLPVVGVVAAERGAVATAGGDLVDRLLDGARPSEGRRPATHAATGELDRGAPLPGDESDALARPPARPGDERHPGLEGTVGHTRNLPRTGPPTEPRRDREALSPGRLG